MTKSSNAFASQGLGSAERRKEGKALSSGRRGWGVCGRR